MYFYSRLILIQYLVNRRKSLMSTCCSMCLANKSSCLVLSCIHFICTECSRNKLKFENDYIMECCCGVKTPLNITVRTSDPNSSQLAC